MVDEDGPDVRRLTPLRSDGERSRHFAARPEALAVATAEALCREAARLTATRPEKARHVVETVGWIAERLDDDRARALEQRARANLLLYAHDYRGATDYYERALELFERAGDELGAAITRTVAIGGLSHLGDYERAYEWAAAARATLTRLGESERLARLEFNVGHLKARQDRFAEALEHFRTGYEVVRVHGEPRDVGQALRNLAVCYQDLNDFEASFATYQEARRYLRRQGLRPQALEVEYNLAYLYYLRGQYTRAIRAFEQARLTCRREGDRHHEALCDLDQAEISLELNLTVEAAELAERAHRGFSALGMSYEAAKALTYRALAAARRGESEQAADGLRRAREVFARQGNRVWAAMTDLYEARLLAHQRRQAEAREIAERAYRSFAEEHVPGRTAACEILLAKLARLDSDLDGARLRCAAALQRLDGLGFPALEFQAQLTAGRIEESAGDRQAALAAYRRAEKTLEKLRGQLATDEIKIAFGRDKEELYAGLVCLLLAGEPARQEREAAFGFIERAKSRALTDLLAFHAVERRDPHSADPELAAELADLRERLNWHDRRLRQEELRAGDRSPETSERLQGERRQIESRLQRCLRRLRIADPELSSLQEAGTAPLGSLREALPEGALLLEYYLARGRIYACLLGRRRLQIRRLGEAQEAASIYRRFRFQLGKFRLGSDYLGQFGATVEEATTRALTGLYDLLLRPIRDELDREHLVVVPHGFLHQLPFHALSDGDGFLIDRMSVSYAPSATVFQLCQQRRGEPGRGALVLGIPDEKAPLIADEARAVAELLPGSRLLLGAAATRRALIEHGSGRRFLHIATHGHFRRDNPMFSAISLGDARLSLFDLYDLRLDADLVVLSGCATGLSEVDAGDEIVGLTRGLLHAGARSLVATLWDVNDESTSRLMRSFYRHLLAGTAPAESLRRSQLALRRSHPQPYYWAPFVLIGRLGGPVAGSPA